MRRDSPIELIDAIRAMLAGQRLVDLDEDTARDTTSAAVDPV